MVALSLSKRSARIEQAEIRAMSIECEKAGGINLAQGVCDTQVPLLIGENAHRGIENGINSYSRFDGLVELREAIAQKIGLYNGIEGDPETEIVVSAGYTGAFYCTCLALLDPGDEVILFETYYGKSREHASCGGGGSCLRHPSAPLIGSLQWLTWNEQQQRGPKRS